MNEKEKLEGRLKDLKFKLGKLIKEKAASPKDIMQKLPSLQAEIGKLEKELAVLK